MDGLQATHGSVFCPRCQTQMLGEVLVGRGSASETSVPRITGLTCWKCGNWIEVLPEPKAIDPAMMKPNKVHQYTGGRRPGYTVSPAARMAERFFNEILRLRREGSGWESITKLIRQATEKRFCDKTLERYWLEECVRRGVKPMASAVKRGAMGGKKSAALRKLKEGAV